MEAKPEKLLLWSEKGFVRIVEESGAGEIVRFNSPVFGELEGIVLERGDDTFTLRHPLTGETVTLPNEWLVSLEERSAIIEHDGGLPREEADARAQAEFYALFRKGGMQ